MKRSILKHPIRAAAICAVAMGIAACGGGGGGGGHDETSGTGGTGTGTAAGPTVKVDDLSAGAYAVSSGDTGQPTVGRYFAGADGSRLLALEGADETVTGVLRRAGGTAPWIAMPAPEADLDVRLLSSRALAAPSPDPATLAGRYVIRLADGSAADLRIGADGQVSAGTLSNCRISGALAAGGLPGSLSATLATTGCAGLPASATGVLLTDPSDAPAAWRLIGDDGRQPVDLRGYREAAA
ncbi:MAG: hypothetical protein QM766_02475 [Burkholderiaceae bacterium]